MDFDGFASQIQLLLQNSPLIILGSGASMKYGLPSMGMLSNTILSNKSGVSEPAFSSFCDLLDQGVDLESAVNQVTLSDHTRNWIRNRVWQDINSRDLSFLDGGIDSASFGIAQLLEKVIQPTPNKAVIVTTNYDRIAEYAADLLSSTCVTGFEGSLIRQMEFATAKTISKRVRNRERTVEIWKVHGSLDWFAKTDGSIASYPLSTKIPEGYTPLIIPPGKDKYSKTHNEPYRTIITQADQAFTEAGSYLCIGYGFNDDHIQPKLLNQVRSNKPIVVLAKRMSLACQKLICEGGISRYIIIEESAFGVTKVHGNGWEAEYEGDYWQLDNFLKIW